MKNKRWWIIGLLVSLAVAALSPLASSSPDGLERVAEQLGFVDRAREPLYEVMPDYVLPGVTNEAAATILAAVAGVLIVFGLAFGLAHVLRARGDRGQPGEV